VKVGLLAILAAGIRALRGGKPFGKLGAVLQVECTVHGGTVKVCVDL
jgi:hypothetical protein